MTVPVESLLLVVILGIMRVNVEKAAAANVQEIKSVIDILEIVIAVVLDIMEPFFTIDVEVTAPDHTTPVTVPVESVRQAVSQGTEGLNVLNASRFKCLVQKHLAFP